MLTRWVFDEAPADDYLEGLSSLTDIVDEGLTGTFRVRRIGEPAQVDHEALELLTEARLRPGEIVLVTPEEDRVVVARDGAHLIGVDMPQAGQARGSLPSPLSGKR